MRLFTVFISTVVASSDYIQYAEKMAAPAKEIAKELPNPLRKVWVLMEQSALNLGSYIAGSRQLIPLLLSLMFGGIPSMISGLHAAHQSSIKGKVHAREFLRLLEFADAEYPKLVLPVAGRDEFDKVERVLESKGDDFQKLLTTEYEPASVNLRTFWMTKLKLLSILVAGQICAMHDKVMIQKMVESVPESERAQIQASLAQCEKVQDLFPIFKLGRQCHHGYDRENCTKYIKVMLPCFRSGKTKEDCENSDGFWKDWVYGGSKGDFNEPLKEAATKIAMLNERDKILPRKLMTWQNVAKTAAVGAGVAAAVWLGKKNPTNPVDKESTVSRKGAEPADHTLLYVALSVILIVIVTVVFVVIKGRSDP